MSAIHRRVVGTWTYGEFQSVLFSTGGFQVYSTAHRSTGKTNTPEGVTGARVAAFSCMDEDLIASGFPMEFLRGVAELFTHPATLSPYEQVWGREELLKIDYSPVHGEGLATIRASDLTPAEQVAALASMVGYNMRFDAEIIEALLLQARPLSDFPSDSITWGNAYTAFLTPLAFTASTEEPLKALEVRRFHQKQDLAFVNGIFQFLDQPDEHLTLGDYFALEPDPTVLRVSLPQDFSLMVHEKLKTVKRRADLNPLTAAQLEDFLGNYLTAEIGHLARWQVKRLLAGSKPLAVTNRRDQCHPFNLAPWLLTESEWRQLSQADFTQRRFASLRQIATASSRASANITMLVAELGLEATALLCDEMVDGLDYGECHRFCMRMSRVVEAQKLLLLAEEPCRDLAPPFAVTMALLHPEGETSHAKRRR